MLRWHKHEGSALHTPSWLEAFIGVVQGAKLLFEISLIMGSQLRTFHCPLLQNAINLYKNTPEKVMPQARPRYISECSAWSSVSWLWNHPLRHQARQFHTRKQASVALWTGISVTISPSSLLFSVLTQPGACLCLTQIFGTRQQRWWLICRLGPDWPGSEYRHETFFRKELHLQGSETSGFQCIEMLSNKPWNYQVET